MDRIFEHYEEAKKLVGSRKVIYTALQGSQNYNLDYENSDVDSKSILVPTLRELTENRKPLSTTHICENEEHIDLKDIRLMFECFKKQNVNFVEILFTDYYVTDSPEMLELRNHAEEVARYCRYLAVKCMKGLAKDKFHALQHPYPSKEYELRTFGYDPKQLSHIVRVSELLDKYLKEIPYKECLITSQRDFILDIKKGKYELSEAKEMAQKYMSHVENVADNFCLKYPKVEKNQEVFDLLEDIKYKIMMKTFKEEILAYV